MTYFLLITAFTVSIDSFVCGFSLAFSGKKKYLIVAIIALTVLFMCTVANCFAGIFADKLTERTACFGGLILIGIGIYNLFKKEEERPLGEGKIVKQSLLTGFAVGLDGAAQTIAVPGWYDLAVSYGTSRTLSLVTPTDTTDVTLTARPAGTLLLIR